MSNTTAAQVTTTGRIAAAIRAAGFTISYLPLPSGRTVVRVDVPTLDPRVFDLMTAVADFGVTVFPAGDGERWTNVAAI